MIKPNQEAQSIKRVETINLKDIKEIKTCDDLIEICLYIIENININISDFIISNKIFGYNTKFDINKSVEEIIYFKNELLEKRKVIKELDFLMDSVLKFDLGSNIPDVIELTGVYYMYLGDFSKGLSIINLSQKLGRKDETSVVTNVEKLNEFIFKFNLSLDIAKLENYKDACGILQDYYKENFRLEKGDQLLIILYESLNQNKKSKQVLDSICNVSNNALFHYEIGKGSGIIEHKIKIAVGIMLILCIGGGVVFSKDISKGTSYLASKISSFSSPKESSKADDKKEDEPIAEAPLEKKEVEPIVKEDKPTVSEEPQVKAVDINTLKGMVDGNLSVEIIGSIDKQIKLFDSNKEAIGSSEYQKIKKQFLGKKQAFYYNLGKKDYKAGNIDNSIKSLEIAYNEKTGDYLEPHILYYLASAVNKKNPNDSKKYYEEYVNKYGKDKENGSYVEEAIYNLAIINWNSNNKAEAKKYAKKIRDEYSKSMYNNEKIKTILI